MPLGDGAPSPGPGESLNTSQIQVEQGSTGTPPLRLPPPFGLTHRGQERSEIPGPSSSGLSSITSSTESDRPGAGGLKSNPFYDPSQGQTHRQLTLDSE